MGGHDLSGGMSVVVIEPEGPRDKLSITLAKDNISVATVLLNPSESAELINDLKKAYNEFIG